MNNMFAACPICGQIHKIDIVDLQKRQEFLSANYDLRSTEEYIDGEDVVSSVMQYNLVSAGIADGCWSGEVKQDNYIVKAYGLLEVKVLRHKPGLYVEYAVSCPAEGLVPPVMLKNQMEKICGFKLKIRDIQNHEYASAAAVYFDVILG